MTRADPSISPRLEAFPHQTVLADGPSRRVVRYAAAPGGDDGPSIIAKFYRDDEGARTARSMEALNAALEQSAPAVLGVPRVLGYDAERKLLLQESARGGRFDAVLAGPNGLKALHLAGQALATLHGLSATVGPARRMADHVEDLIRPHPGQLAQELRALAPRLDRILAALLAAEARWRPFLRDVPIHRDVHPRQLFLDGHRVCLIDWDLCADGDGALDVGNFVAYLRARCQMEDRAIDALLRGYGVTGGSDVLERAPLYEALTYVRLCCKRFRLGEAGFGEECAALVARAERCLASVS